MIPNVTFFSKGGLTVPRLHEFTHAIVRENIDLVFLEIAANDITSETSVGELGDSVLALANFLTAMTDVRHVIISQMYFRDGAASVITECMPIINIYARCLQFV